MKRYILINNYETENSATMLQAIEKISKSDVKQYLKFMVFTTLDVNNSKY